jgi:hypothetical protein
MHSHGFADDDAISSTNAGGAVGTGTSVEAVPGVRRLSLL